MSRNISISKAEQLNYAQEEAVSEEDTVSVDHAATDRARQGGENLTERYQDLLERQRDMLTLFSGDQRLTYRLDEQGEHFVLEPKKLSVLVPLAFFQSQKYSQNRFLFHMYETLALYPDWQRSPERYLNRLQAYREDAEEMTSYFLAKVQAAGLSDDAAYQPAGVFTHMEDEIEEFLEGCDVWISVLAVMEEAPVYRNPDEKKDIGRMLLLEDTFPQEDNPLAVHRDLTGSLLVAEFYGIDEIGWEEIRQELRAPVFGEERFSFLRQAVREEILRHEGIEKRDPLIHTLLFPAFFALWKQDINRMELSRTIEEEQETGKKTKGRRRRTPQMTPDARQKMLRELEEEKKAHAESVERLLDGKADLSVYGVTGDDQQLFAHYEAQVRPVREEMKRYWQKLIGEASREVSVLQTGVTKGKLDVEALIQAWPDLTEAERRQNYKDLRIFDTYELQKQTKELPQYLDITFVIDNSGSMRSGKLQPAREALATVLLSLRDFEQYLMANAQQTHQRIEVRTQTWLFGTTYREVLHFDDRLQKREANTILSITRLDGSMGSTDDGACLNEILQQLTPSAIQEQISGRRVRMIFEVTDGASSFPGAAKKAVEELTKDHVQIQAIEIGSGKDAAARNAFAYIFGEHGVFLGDNISQLPSALIHSVQNEMTHIFHR